MKVTKRNQELQLKMEREQIERFVKELEAADFDYVFEKHPDLWWRIKEKCKELFWQT